MTSVSWQNSQPEGRVLRNTFRSVYGLLKKELKNTQINTELVSKLSDTLCRLARTKAELARVSDFEERIKKLEAIAQMVPKGEIAN